MKDGTTASYAPGNTMLITGLTSLQSSGEDLDYASLFEVTRGWHADIYGFL